MAIVPGSDVENPIEDAAFLAQIGAKQIGEGADSVEYEMENARTGTRFMFQWDFSESYWSLVSDDLHEPY